MSVSVLLENVCQTVGEGPHWDEETQTLFFVDIMQGNMHSWKYKTGQHTVRNLGV